MAYPKEFRNKLGITQAAFAELIDCSFGQLSMAESGLRSLPDSCLPAITALEKAFATTTTPPTETKPDEAVKTLLDKHIRQCKTKLNYLEMVWEELADKREKCQRFLQMTKAYEAAPFLPNTSVAHLRMQILQRNMKKKYAEYNAENVRLQLAMAGLQAENEKAKELTTY